MTDQTETPTKRTKRRASDDYPTPGPVVEAFLDQIEWFKVRSFLEPCAGDGAIFFPAQSRVLALNPYAICTKAEIRKGVDYLDTHFVIASAGGGQARPFDLVVTNPPFGLAAQFLQKCLAEAVTVCFLLRAAWPAGPRAGLLRLMPPTHVYYLENRPAFVATCQRKSCDASAALGTRECPECGDRMRDTTDMHEYAWFCWDRGRLLRTRAPFNWI